MSEHNPCNAPAKRRPHVGASRSKRIVAVAAASACAFAGIGAARANADAPTPNEPAAAAGIGSAAVPDSAYAIPSGARFVSTSGSDRNPGTAGAPFRTIAHALAKTRAGGTIVVRGGTYRESLGSVSKRVTIEAYRHEQVWMKGSVLVDGFAKTGKAWVKNGWSSKLCHTCFPRSAIDPAHPAAGLPDQVFVDNRPLAQVTAPGALRAGAFYVDTKRRRLYLGSNPNGHTIEATYYSVAMQFNGRSSGSRLLGIGITEYGPHFNYDLPAMVVGNTTNLTFERDAFTWSATRGLSVLRPGADIEQNVFMYNGANGLHANRADGLIVMDNRFGYSNYEQFSIASSATAAIAALKVTYTKNVVVKHNYVDDSASTAVWIDLSSSNVTISDNRIVRNSGFGIMYEISSRGIVAGNVVSQSGRDGIRVDGSNNTAVWNNSLVDNGWSQLGVYDDSRSLSNRSRHGGATWNTADVTVFNNVLTAGPDSTKPLWNSFDASHPRRRTTLEMVSGDGTNQYTLPARSQHVALASWQTTLRTTTQWPTLGALRAATGREQGSITSGGSGSPGTSAGMGAGMGAGAGATVEPLVPAASALLTGRPLPPDVAAAIGVSGRVPVGAPAGVVPPGTPAAE